MLYKNMSETVLLEDYNYYSFVMRGNTRPYKEELKKMGGRWNPNLKGGEGWIFSKRRHKEEVEKWVRELQFSFDEASGRNREVPWEDQEEDESQMYDQKGEEQIKKTINELYKKFYRMITVMGFANAIFIFSVYSEKCTC